MPLQKEIVYLSTIRAPAQLLAATQAGVPVQPIVVPRQPESSSLTQHELRRIVLDLIG